MSQFFRLKKANSPKRHSIRSHVAQGMSIAGQAIPPAAANMMEMRYSCELEQKAEELIASCPEILEPAPLKNLEYNVDVVKEIDITTAFKTMMNAETTRLGCAIKLCGLKFYISCYYGDKLATDGLAIYHNGEPCSECPTEKLCPDGLCFS
ncbi:unnamed protein product [Heligmosomoides polygyrus]|uniref:SCP domain-containing protein n=1 Tax=Heligmosomoides polygyrus TaxID=6339 RepID=A0A3P7Z9I3_HELPZ|nr:unnamed protein product [Heligmosomoides polygyrus]